MRGASAKEPNIKRDKYKAGDWAGGYACGQVNAQEIQCSYRHLSDTWENREGMCVDRACGLKGLVALSALVEFIHGVQWSEVEWSGMEWNGME